MKSKKGFTLIEILIVASILGILATLAVSHYNSSRENVLDNQVFSDLKMLQAAQQAYKSETGTYYPSSGSVSSISLINSNLGVSLQRGSHRPWNFRVYSDGCGEATRTDTNVFSCIRGSSKTWHFAINDANDKPDAGTCP